jgi:hypothetical protein
MVPYIDVEGTPCRTTLDMEADTHPFAPLTPGQTAPSLCAQFGWASHRLQVGCLSSSSSKQEMPLT